MATRGKRGGKHQGTASDRRATPGPGLEDALVGIAPPADEIDAGFFHRTLARWLGLPEGRDAGTTPVLWSYDFWKAEIVPLESAGARRRYAAQVYRGLDAHMERYEYWLELDDQRRIRRSGWASGAPDLTSDLGAPAMTAAPSAATLEALFLDAATDDEDVEHVLAVRPEPPRR